MQRLPVTRDTLYNRECSQVRMVDAISQPGCAECGAGGLVLTDYRPYAFLRALLSFTHYVMLSEGEKVFLKSTAGNTYNEGKHELVFSGEYISE